MRGNGAGAGRGWESQHAVVTRIRPRVRGEGGTAAWKPNAQLNSAAERSRSEAARGREVKGGPAPRSGPWSFRSCWLCGQWVKMAQQGLQERRREGGAFGPMTDRGSQRGHSGLVCEAEAP